MRPLPPLYLITDGARVGAARQLEVLREATAAGLSMVQIREKHLAGDALQSEAQRLRDELPEGVMCLLNGPPALARRLGLAGVHVGKPLERVVDARAELGDAATIGYSAHGRDEAIEAFEAGADYVSFSPVFEPISKRSSLAVVGVEALRGVCRAVPGPVYALGGVTASRVPSLRDAGASGVAVIGAILDASEPRRATAEILDAWDGA